jgi:hypothetical protein
MFVPLELAHLVKSSVNPLHLIVKSLLILLKTNVWLPSLVTFLPELENNVQLPLLIAPISHIHHVPLLSLIPSPLDVVNLFQKNVHLISVTLEDVILQQIAVFLKLIVLDLLASLEFVPQLVVLTYQNVTLVLTENVLPFNVMKPLEPALMSLSLDVFPKILASLPLVNPSMVFTNVLLLHSVLNLLTQSVLQSFVKLTPTTNQLVLLNHQIVLHPLVVDLQDVMPRREVVMLFLKMVSVNNLLHV